MGNSKYYLIGIFSSLALFSVFGIITDLIPNPWFLRMVERSFLDYVFLSSTALLTGAYIGVYYYQKEKNRCDYAAYGGGIAGIFAVSCPICSKLLILLLGTTTILTYFEPVRPLFGLLSIGLIGGALYFKLRDVKKDMGPLM